jgi:cold shock CspA family protein
MLIAYQEEDVFPLEEARVMQEPLAIVFRDIVRTPALEALISREMVKLEKVCDYIIAGRVVVEKPQTHQRAGSPFQVRVELHVPPGHHLVVKREPADRDMHDALEKVVIDTFKAAQRQLRRLVDKQRGKVKSHPENEVQGLIVKLFPDKGYGFIMTLDGREVYFHKNSVLNGGFERLGIGMGVRFVEETGDQGPQASTVQVVDHRRHPSA